MKKHKVFIIAAAMLLSLSGCKKVIKEYDEFTTGVVVEKEYVKSHTTTVMMPTMIGKTTTMMPRPVHHPAEFNITIAVLDTYKKYNDVSLYETYNIGDVVEMKIHYVEYDDDTIKRMIDINEEDYQND